MKKRVLSIMLSLVIVVTMSFGMTSAAFAADMMTPTMIKSQVDGKSVNLRAYSASYEGNNFICIRDFANAINGSEKQFNITYDKNKNAVIILKGQAYTAVGGENQPGDRSVEWSSSSVPKLYVNDKKVQYTSYSIGGNTYFKFVDLMQILNINATFNDSNNTIKVDTKKDFDVDFEKTAASGYFDFLHGTVLGNAATGEIIYSNNAENKVAIASTTKIMTYLLLREGIDKKQISWDDDVVISKTAEAVSSSEDGVIPMKAGQKVKLSDLMNTMLVVSSNESATALAEHLSGSEAAFTKLMNKKAKELKLDSAEFYNPHGLPLYTSNLFSAKLQNRMDAKDLFELSRYIINKYPDILEITSKTEITVDSLNFNDVNTNRLLFNLNGVDGLKTGTTNRAGCCIITTMPIQKGDKTERVIAIVLGAEDSAERAEKPAILLQYAKQYYSNK
nr:serine hydrolase [uncultured Aminipila sp.]